MSSKIYNINKLSEQDNINYIDTFIISYQKDDRSLHTLKKLLEKKVIINNLVVLKYLDFPSENFLEEDFSPDKITVIDNLSDGPHFINELKKIKSLLEEDTLYIDISSLNIPELFMIMRYLKLVRYSKKINILYSIPFDYFYESNPFTSFASYSGDLETKELIGYSGDSEKNVNAELLIFIGFEESLSLKIVEDINYSKLFLISGFPSFYQKYKDISIINNYDVINKRQPKINYVPADNPFEVYNFINEISNKKEGLCIAPLSTKPIALGVCLYALDNEDVRIVYPISTSSNLAKTYSVHETLIYEVCFT